MFQYPKSVRICEVSLRDGLQTKPLVSVEDKCEALELMAQAGIRCIEVGSFLPENEIAWRMHNTPDVFKTMKRHEGIVYRALLKTPVGARQALDSGCNFFKINISASDAHYRIAADQGVEDAIKGFKEIGSLAANNNAQIIGSISLAFASPYDPEIKEEYLKHIIRNLVDCGASEISLNDTAGLATPVFVHERFTAMMDAFPEVKSWAFHPHNTRGTGLANCLAAMDAGVPQIDGSLAGIGGCIAFKNASGNISTEDLNYLLSGMGIETGLDMEKLIVAGQFVGNMVNNEGADSYIQKLEKIKKEQGRIE